jgi:hypothetical protein
MFDKVIATWGKEVFRPDLTESSKSYDKSPGIELGQQIYDDNVNHIVDSNRLVFPMGTNDVGTLFEVGVALNLRKEIWGYTDADDDLHLLSDPANQISPGEDLGLFKFQKETLIQVESLNSAVLLGYNYDCKHNMYYVLGLDVNDNLMLRFMATRVKFNSERKKFQFWNYDIKDAA